MIGRRWLAPAALARSALATVALAPLALAPFALGCGKLLSRLRPDAGALATAPDAGAAEDDAGALATPSDEAGGLGLVSYGAAATDAATPVGLAALADASAGACSRPLYGAPGVGYCRRSCRSFLSRQATKHASRVFPPARRGFGKCGAFDVFAETNTEGKGVTELFDPTTHALVGAIDTLVPGCPRYGAVPACTPSIAWEALPKAPNPAQGTKPGGDDDEPDLPNAPPNNPFAPKK